MHRYRADVHARVGHRLVALRAIAGEDAGRRIEQTLSAIDGVLAVSVNLPAQRARVEFDRERVTTSAIDQAIRDLDFGAEEVVLPAAPVPSETWYRRNRELVWSLTGGAMLATAFGVERAIGGPTVLTLTLYGASYAFGGFDLVRHAFASLRRGQFVFDIDLLMLFAALGAAILGEWAEGAFLLFLFSLAHSLEHYALGRARASIRALADLAPPVARVQRGTDVVEVPQRTSKRVTLSLCDRPTEFQLTARCRPVNRLSIRRPSPENPCRSTKDRTMKSLPEPSMARACSRFSRHAPQAIARWIA